MFQIRTATTDCGNCCEAHSHKWICSKQRDDASHGPRRPFDGCVGRHVEREKVFVALITLSQVDVLPKVERLMVLQTIPPDQRLLYK